MEDGAVCLRNHREILTLEAVLLDFFHLSEDVIDASHKTLREKTEAGRKWVQDVYHTLKHEDYSQPELTSACNPTICKP
jgi:hypothetical protein